MKTHRGGYEEPLLLARCPQEGGLGGCSEHLPKPFGLGIPPCFSPTQHWLPTYAYSLVEQKYASGRADEPQDQHARS